MHSQYHVGILLFDSVDALDFTGPYEVFDMTTYKCSDVKQLLINELKEKPFKVSAINVIKNVKYVDDGNVTTPAGVSSGIHYTLLKS